MDKEAIVTGGCRVLDRAVVARLRNEGWRVAVIDIAPSPAGMEADVVRGGVDLSDGAAVAAACDDVVRRLGRLDALANIAGGFVRETIRLNSPLPGLYRRLESCASQDRSQEYGRRPCAPPSSAQCHAGLASYDAVEGGHPPHQLTHTIAIDENDTAQNGPIIKACTAMALRKIGLKTGHLLIRQPKQITHPSGTSRIA